MSKLHDFVGRQYSAVINGIEETGNIIISKIDPSKIALDRKYGPSYIVYDPDALYMEGESNIITKFLILSDEFYGERLTDVSQLSVGGTLIYKHFTPRIITKISGDTIYYHKRGETKIHNLSISEFKEKIWAYRYRPAVFKGNDIDIDKTHSSIMAAYKSPINTSTEVESLQPTKSPTIPKKSVNKYFKRLTLNDI